VKINIVSENDLEHWEDIEDLRKFKAYVYNVGFVNNKRIFNVYLNAKHYKKNAKKQKTRCKNLMLDLAHELVHVKQYLNNELFDYVAGGVRYKGTYFDASKLTSDEEYYDSPWEIEAYGREHGLVEMFNNKMEESKR
jgi:hypothetical protein